MEAHRSVDVLAWSAQDTYAKTAFSHLIAHLGLGGGGLGRVRSGALENTKLHNGVVLD